MLYYFLLFNTNLDKMFRTVYNTFVILVYMCVEKYVNVKIEKIFFSLSCTLHVKLEKSRVRTKPT
jgi:hypothetical protein